MIHNVKRAALVLVAALVTLGCKPEAKPTADEKADECCKMTSARMTDTAPVAPASQADNQAGWRVLFDGRSMDKWKTTDFGGNAQASVEDGEMILPQGDILSGVNFTGKTPTMNYEVEVVARRRLGNDFFCGLTVPVGQSHVSLILGGWGGSLCGISSIDGDDASENSTTSFQKFEKNKWYTARLRVTGDRLQAWLDDKEIVNVETDNHKLNTRIEVSKSEPFGLASYQTEAGIKSVKIRELPADSK